MNNIEVFLKASRFAVAGASRDRSKYGNKIFRSIVASGRTVYPLNPTETEVEGDPARWKMVYDLRSRLVGKNVR
jgi:uncharacterized protein